jgi:hypothetical protein
MMRLWLKFFTPHPADVYIREQYKGIEMKLDHKPAGFHTQFGNRRGSQKARHS